ncbi:unnamed protein product [Pocillopora meandrina]|uniref:Uncharacterized protein n=1 Tax=Pocillopora meandrina TaxID=46732 RepID=A0AAU9X085_9CNID|nr:unnamed protein product [Pocillopora meandrina]
MVLLRDLVLSCLTHNILFQARHIPGLINSRADYLSRFQVVKFKELSPEADDFPTKVPENLMPKIPNCIPLFISYLSFRKMAYSTINSYLSAISYVHKLKGLRDPTKSFLIQKLLTALSWSISHWRTCRQEHAFGLISCSISQLDLFDL